MRRRKNRSHKKTNADTSKIIQRKHLHHLTTAHWTCSTAAAVGVGHENGTNTNIYIYTYIYIYIYIYTYIYIYILRFFKSVSLFAFLKKGLTMLLFIFLCLSFFSMWHLNYFDTADRSLATCQRTCFL